jgi:hypothetical protein
MSVKRIFGKDRLIEQKRKEWAVESLRNDKGLETMFIL